jgi:hypothetical protein
LVIFGLMDQPIQVGAVTRRCQSLGEAGQRFALDNGEAANHYFNGSSNEP